MNDQDNRSLGTAVRILTEHIGMLEWKLDGLKQKNSRLEAEVKQLRETLERHEIGIVE